ncbi:MAG TPA: hypothetical protein VL793_04030 [Patescibacteria group bacterium]|nr:hypothetical protein [Patescibacteria group bacterium]
MNSIFKSEWPAQSRPSSIAVGSRLSTLDPRPKFGFSLIEIMVTVGLLTFIILGLLLMFNQTQRAFRTGMTQTDVLEAGRATMDIISRELEQMSPSQYPDFIDNAGRHRAMNFLVEPFPPWTNVLLQDLPGNTGVVQRINVMQRFYFMTKQNQDWVATGYEVVPDPGNSWIGTLYRFSSTNYPRTGPFTNDGYFRLAAITNLSRIADGVVHLRLRAFAKNGYLLSTNTITRTNAMFATRVSGFYTNVPNAVLYGSSSLYNPGTPGGEADYRQASCYFMSNALPGYLELELGILEPQILQKYRSIPLLSAAQNYLSNHVAQVHIFRQRIPVRNVDLSAYP